MSLPVIFSLIFATLLGLLPIFLLVGRRVIASRLSRRGERAQGQGSSESATPAPGDAPASQVRLGVSGTGDPAGESAILDRLIRERRGAAEPERDVERMRLGNRQFGSARMDVTSDASTRNGSWADGSRADGSRLETRLGRLSLLQRAVVYREILGPPVGLRAPGEYERY